MNKIFISITLFTTVTLIWNPSWVNAFQPEIAITRVQEESRAADAFRATHDADTVRAITRYQAEAVHNNRMNHPLNQATQQLKDAESSEDKKAATDAIRTELGKQYDQFLEANERQIEELQDRLDKLREQLVRRQDAKEKMVDLELERVINESEGLVWPSSGGRGGIQAFPSSNMNPDSLNWSNELFRYHQNPNPAAIPATNRPAPPSPPARARSPR